MLIAAALARTARGPLRIPDRRTRVKTNSVLSMSAAPAGRGPVAREALCCKLHIVTTFLTVLLVITMLGVVATLIAGVGGMVKGASNPMRSNRLMQLRVLLQGLAIAIVAILLMMR
jgi:hypothetical protein